MKQCCCVMSPLIILSLQVTTSMEQQATESSLCERNTTAGLSTQGKDSGNSWTLHEVVKYLTSSNAIDSFVLIFSLCGQCVTDGVRGGWSGPDLLLRGLVLPGGPGLWLLTLWHPPHGPHWRKLHQPGALHTRLLAAPSWLAQHGPSPQWYWLQRVLSHPGLTGTLAGLVVREL